MHDVVFDIPKLANDRLHLKNFEKAEVSHLRRKNML